MFHGTPSEVPQSEANYFQRGPKIEKQPMSTKQQSQEKPSAVLEIAMLAQDVGGLADGTEEEEEMESKL